MNTPVYDLSDFDDDVDLSMFEDDPSGEKGAVYWPGVEDGKLFDYQILDGSVSINLTGKGKSLFRTDQVELHDVDSIVFAHFLGLQAENSKDLEKRTEDATGLPFVSNDAIIEAAKRENRFEIRNEEQTVIKTIVRPTQSQIVSEDLSDLEQKCELNTVRHGVRNIASVYKQVEGELKPYMIKFVAGGAEKTRLNEESRMMAFEHAALESLRRHGVQAVSSEIFKSDSGATYLITERFDGRTFSADGAIKKDEMYTPISWMQTVKKGHFSPLSATEAPRALSDLTKKHPLSEDILTRHIFNKLIGNADAHGFNVGLISRIEDGAVKRRIAPAFDVTPYLMGQSSPEAAEDFGLKGRVLSNLSLRDLADSDAMIKEVNYNNPDLATKAYQRAIDARSTMISIIENDLVKNGCLGKSDAEELKGYMSRPLGGSDNEPVSNRPRSSESLFGFDENAKSAFKQRALKQEVTGEQQYGATH